MIVANDALPPAGPGAGQAGRGNDNGFVFKRGRLAGSAPRAVRAVRAAVTSELTSAVQGEENYSTAATVGTQPATTGSPRKTPTRKRTAPSSTPNRSGSRLEFPEPKRRLTVSPVPVDAVGASQSVGSRDIVQDISVPMRRAPQPTPLIPRTRTRVVETPAESSAGGQPTPKQQRRRSASGRRTAGPINAANGDESSGKPQQRARRKSTMGRRRSTFSMRGKRASSIGGGFKALPHDSVDAADFYRHISPELPEPIRLRQLLAWCARRTSETVKWPGELPEHVSKMLSDAIREAMEDVHSAFEKGEIATSWYHRPVDPFANVDASELQPHPENTANREAKEKLLARIELLQKEDDQWVGELKRASAGHARALDRLPRVVQALPSKEQGDEAAIIEPISKALSSIDWSPVDSSAAKYVQEADTGVIDKELDAAEALIENTTRELEIQLDAFHLDMHRANETHKHALDVCDKQLRHIGFVFEQRRARAQVVATVAKNSGGGQDPATCTEDMADTTRDLLRTLAATLSTQN